MLIPCYDENRTGHHGYGTNDSTFGIDEGRHFIILNEILTQQLPALPAQKGSVRTGFGRVQRHRPFSEP